jgi:hypothetical protein
MGVVVSIHDLRGLVGALLASSVSSHRVPAASCAWLAGAVPAVRIADLAPVGARRGVAGSVGASPTPAA